MAITAYIALGSNLGDRQGQLDRAVAELRQQAGIAVVRVSSYRDLPEILLAQIEHFFTRYKDLEKGKWVKVKGWAEPGEAADLIRASVTRAEQHQKS